MIIDAHVHAFPDFLAEKAMATLMDMATVKLPPQYDGSLGGLLQAMDRSGVDRAVLVNIATAPGQTASILEWCAQIQDERIVPLPSVHPDNRDLPGIMERIHEAGFPGIKLHPIYQGRVLDHDDWTPVYEAACDHGLVIAFHMGYDLAFPTDDAAGPARLGRVLDRFPGLRCFAAHFGGWNMWVEVRDTLAGRGVFLGTSFVFGYIEPNLFEEILECNGIDRLVYGTDSPWQSQGAVIDAIRELGLAPEDEEKVFHGNAEALYDLRP